AKPVKINQPPPQFLTKLLGKTGDQQVSAGLSYRPKSVQGIPTPLTLQPKTHAAAAGILTKNFRRTNPAPSSEPPSPRTQSRGLQPYTKPYNRRALQPALAKAKTLAKHTTKTHLFYPPILPPTSPEPTL